MSVSFVRRSALAAAALPLLLAGCTQDEPVPQFPDPTTPTRSPSATKTTAAPESWEEKSDEGAIAFARHWIKLFDDARLERNLGPFEAANTKACRTCANMVEIIEGWQSDGTVYESGEWRVTQVAIIAAAPNRAQLGLRVVRPPERVTDGDGDITEHARSKITYDATVRWSGDGWRMHELVIVK